SKISLPILSLLLLSLILPLQSPINFDYNQLHLAGSVFRSFQKAGSHMRKITSFLAGLCLTASANAAVVTLTMRLHESPSGTITPNNQFNLYATVSQGDNSGLFSFGIDFNTTSEGG